MTFSLKNLYKETANRRYVKMISKKDGFCKECEDEIQEGDFIIWDTLEFKVYCDVCGKEYL